MTKLTKSGHIDGRTREGRAETAKRVAAIERKRRAKNLTAKLERMAELRTEHDLTPSGRSDPLWKAWADYYAQYSWDVVELRTKPRLAASTNAQKLLRLIYFYELLLEGLQDAPLSADWAEQIAIDIFYQSPIYRLRQPVPAKVLQELKTKFWHERVKPKLIDLPEFPEWLK
jgi:hypothetical protein